MIDKIAVLLGGRVAEKLILHDISGGASNDIQRATEIARKMVTQYGMSETLGPIVFGSGHDEVFLGKDFGTARNYSEKIAAAIDDEIHSIVTKGYEIAEKILIDNMEKLHFIAEFLVKYETMDRDQFVAVFEENPTFEKLLAIKDEKRQKSKANNEKQRKENLRKERESKIKEEQERQQEESQQADGSSDKTE
jgi:cell division protease FtsH